MEINNVGRRVAILRKEKGWSQMDLAEKLNVSDKTVSKWENGGMPGIDLFPKMAKLFGVSIDYLMTGDDGDTSAEELYDESDLNSNESQKADNTDADVDSNNTVKKLELPENYECPKCKKINSSPKDHCQFCFHSFAEDFATSFDEQTHKNDSSGGIACAKCGRVNKSSSTHCQFCYHEFTEEEKSGKIVNPQRKNTNANANRDKKKVLCPNCKKMNYYPGDKCVFCDHIFNPSSNRTQNIDPYYSYYDPVNPQRSASSVGCLAYLIAFLIPLIGLIYGIVKRNKGLIIFSIIIAVIPILIFLTLISLGVIVGIAMA